MPNSTPPRRIDTLSKCINVLHITNTDLVGRRFNGYDLITDFEERDIICSQLVLTKESNNPQVFQLLKSPSDNNYQTFISEYSQKTSLDSLITPWALSIIDTPVFQKSDVVHLHLIHNNVLSVLDIKLLSKLKPVVWTWHDAWPMTGHCIQPLECKKWMNGCRNCAHLDYPFAIKQDTAAALWKAKYSASKETDVHIIYASDFAKGLIDKSPIGNLYKHQHLIPFGIDLPKGLLCYEEARKRLSLSNDEVVLFFRHDDVALKGCKYLFEALRKIPNDKLVLLSVGSQDLPEDLTKKFRTIHIPWTDNECDFFNIFNAADIFVMPSLAESFGLMALEAMALNKPVVYFQGTAIEEIVPSGDCGLAAQYKSSESLKECLMQVIKDRPMRERMGAAAKNRQMSTYSKEKYLDALESVYRDIAYTKQKVVLRDCKPSNLVSHSIELAEAIKAASNENTNIRYPMSSSSIRKHYLVFCGRKLIVKICTKLHLLKVARRIKNMIT